MKKQPYNISNKQVNKKSTTAKQTKEILKRLANPKKILQQEAQKNNTGQVHENSVEIQTESDTEQSFKSVTNYQMDTTGTTKADNELVDDNVHPLEQERKTDINLADSGFLEPVIEREYAEKPQTGANANVVPSTSNLSADSVIEPSKTPEQIEPTPEEKPKILFAPRMTIKTDDTYKKVMGDELPQGSSRSQVSTEGQDQAAYIPVMQFQEATFNLSDDAPGIGRQMGEQAGNTTSEWAFGMLENFYPEVVAFFTKIPTDWVEKAKLPNNLEADTLQKILAANARNKNKVKISDFHKKNILPPLKRILEKKGWENVMPDELLLVIGLVVLAADSFFKIVEIKKENKVLEKQIKHKIQEYIDVRTEERKEIDSLRGQLVDMQGFIKQFQAMQQQAGQTAA